jgi:hypothetical protein
VLVSRYLLRGDESLVLQELTRALNRSRRPLPSLREQSHCKRRPQTPGSPAMTEDKE